ncbi:MAG: hypothetical protein HRU38_23795 [Saccharospirillaceae bacterium]|nr:hypothetical protein [Pseudomonadales bacterium]NRB81646.1 hypothetical protein [Saccharospirillaceae bacterium]
MSFVCFDCTQIVTAVRNTTVFSELHICELLSDIFENEVIHETGIKPIKADYIRQYVGSKPVIFEFKDLEFQGEFEDWEDSNLLPYKVNQFVNSINKLVELGYAQIQIFITASVPENGDELTLKIDTSLADFPKALFRYSHCCFDDVGGWNEVIINIQD